MPQHPDWFRELRRKYFLRVTDWATQAWEITVSPHRFLSAWVDGRRETLNPLRFFTVGTAASVLVDRGGRRLLHIAAAPSQGFMGAVNSSMGATLLVLVAAALLHLVLRVRSRAPLRSSVAAVMFTSAGPGVLLSALGWIVSGAIHLAKGHVDGAIYNGAFTPWPVLALWCVGLVWAVAALVGVHRVRWWWSVIALAAAPVILGLVTMMVVLGLRVFAPHVSQDIQVARPSKHDTMKIGVFKSD